MTFAYPTNVTGLVSIATYVNTVTENMFWTFMLFAVVITVFLAFVTTGNIKKEDAIMGTAFIGLILSVLMRVLDLVSNSLIFLMVVLLGIGIVMAHLASTRVSY